jgi:hypothetical protein
MHWFYSFLMILILSADPLSADVPSESLSTLEGLVDTWTRLRKEIATEKREWSEQKTFLQAEIDLLRQEAANLSGEITEFREFSSSEEQEIEQDLEIKENLTAILNDLEPVLTRLESDLRAQLSRIPHPLRPGFESVVAAFPDANARPVSVRVVDRIQALAGALIHLEDLHPQLHVVREVLEDDSGTRREMEVLYLGLARAFAVSTSNDWAGVGVPTPDGWRWSARPELIPTIRSAIEMAQQRLSADFLYLPFSLHEKGEGE